MPSISPLVASGSRDLKRPRAVPKLVREAVHIMVFGLPDDESGKPIDFITAARRVGMQPFVLRRYFDRGEVRSLLRSERSAFRAMINAGNELALRSIRDSAQNSMAQIAAVRSLEDLHEREVVQSRGTQQTPGIVINIVQPNDTATPATTMIDAQPIAESEQFDADGHRPDEHGEPVIDPSRPRR